MKRKLNKKRVFLSVLVLLLIILTLIFICFKINHKKEEKNIVTTKQKIITEPIEIIEVQEQQQEEEIILTTMYTTTGVNMRDNPSLEGNIIQVLNVNTEVSKVKDIDDEWSMIQYEGSTYYIASQYLSTEKQPLTTRGSSVPRTSTQGVLTKSKGVNYFNGHRETWYSQRVLPGGGLKIPGRHVAADGTIRDENDYICVASEDYPKGTVVETSLGLGKVYDCRMS